ncbi:esterase [Bacteroidia bacterium]|nr:esterase [Bacteroidia bacterium]
MDPAKLAQIDAAVEKYMTGKELSGCVVCVGRQGKIALLKAYGDKKVDMVFDLASVGKPMATATSIMLLAERGKLKIDDPVALYLKEFDTPEKKEITIRHLLLHVGGFPQGPGGPYDDPVDFMERVLAQKPQSKPGEKFLYSCSSYIMLGKIVERISGQDLNEFTRKNIYRPLGMYDTGYIRDEIVPDENYRKRISPVPGSRPGQVNDFQARAQGGVGGNGAIFSTADDMAVFAEMMLEKGKLPNRPRLMNAETVELMTTPNPVPSAPAGLRGLGWTMQIEQDNHRPKKMSPAAYGHGGWTGIAFWMEPKYDLFFIFLSTLPGRVPYPLASQIGDIVIDAIAVHVAR